MMEDKESVLWSKGYQVKFQGTCVYIWCPIYGEEATLPEMCELEDFEDWLDDKEKREVRARALERTVLDGASYKMAYEDEVLEMCYEKLREEVNERIEIWENVKTVHRKINGYDVYLYTFVGENDGYVTYYVEMEIPEELYDQMDADAIIDLFDSMLEEMDYPDLGISEFI